VFPCADADIVVAVGSEGLWRRFAAVVGIDPDRADVATNGDRVRNVEALEAEIGAVLRGRPASDTLAALEAAGVPAGRIRSLPDVYAWEQVRHLGLVHELVHPTLGTVAVPGSPLRFDGIPAASPVAPPVLGQHEAEREVVRP
jgi:formyl-CoA transferase